MSSRLNDILALIGFGFVVAGFYLWLGLAAALILTGISFMYAAVRLEFGKQYESD